GAWSGDGFVGAVTGQESPSFKGGGAGSNLHSGCFTMTISFLTDTTWKRLTKLAWQTTSAKVAVAYLCQGASKLLPLKSGSVLVVDLSKAAVRSGQACPQEVIKLLRKGVEVHSCSNLHAKVFAFGRRAIIGSTNVSRNSEHALIEAAVETTEPEVVRSC